jgi:hypothetical protein
MTSFLAFFSDTLGCGAKSIPWLEMPKKQRQCMPTGGRKASGKLEKNAQMSYD